MRKILFTGALLAFTATAAVSQDCKVAVQNLSLSYTGDCKGGKAEGKGKATGVDTYEGEFKSGYPEGAGTYTWKEGSWFTGTFKKGLREGQGEMHYKTQSGSDSLVTGFWKKDVYQGRYEKPFKIISQSGKISSLRVTKNAGSTLKDISVTITNTSGGNGGFGSVKLTLNDITIAKGNYATKQSFESSSRESRTVLKNVDFPFRATFRMADHMFDIEFFEEGSYTVEVSILQ